ncbi:P-loop containing nucleoside triphosphate hydrolase superfamily protein [Zea mays]|uniref:p-loop containing nucleoside triphosphate hydrolase superfamily protein n=1 Tax=Zea mays TaxID=4577 RepID=A0A1D6EZJ0_MAIZE|nr:P-loop containing nucleoside triphosphate hydrolase superfamily protein [Zea mays]
MLSPSPQHRRPTPLEIPAVVHGGRAARRGGPAAGQCCRARGRGDGGVLRALVMASPPCSARTSTAPSAGSSAPMPRWPASTGS